MSAPAAAGRVLPTLNEDGTRRWLRPKPSYGGHFVRRRRLAYALMFVFFVIPYLRMRGKPLVLLDLPRRQFTLFGTTFLPTDTLLLMLLMASILITVFLLTALFGRVWCGWACPQTVYMEFLFRPIERWLEGGPSGSRMMDARGIRGLVTRKRLIKYGVYLLLALFLAHTFLAYFVGVDELALWVRRSPVQHPTSFAVMALVTAGVMLDFTYFREQVCLVACPYGRVQSVLLDRQSLIVAYDTKRGEPRMKGKVRPPSAGACIDCNACVATCPTGIDIRDGLQMECIHCTQCADACDEIMTRVAQPTGLIRYSSSAALAGERVKRLRPRVVLYPLALAASLGGFAFALGTKSTADVTILRGLGEPYVIEADGRVANQVRIKIANRSRADHRYTIDVSGIEKAGVIAPDNPLAVAAGSTEMTTMFVLVPRGDFHDGEARALITIYDGAGYHEMFPYQLVGPESHDKDSHEQAERGGR